MPYAPSGATGINQTNQPKLSSGADNLFISTSELITKYPAQFLHPQDIGKCVTHSTLLDSRQKIRGNARRSV
jgi:hypothetical protein